MAINAPYYLDSPTFSSATAVWTEPTLTIKAPDGYYLFGEDYRQQAGGFLLSTFTCGSCLDCVAGTEVTIGTQIWTGCNLDVTTYSNGDSIPQVTDPTAWIGLTTGAWCYYNNDTVNGTTYGKLYNWYAVNDPRGLAPTGYHIPADTEWTTLIDYLGGDAVAGGKMKETGLCHWSDPNEGATNSSGFTSFGGGSRIDDGTFYFIKKGGYFWSSTENDPDYAWYRILGYNAGDIGRSNADKVSGFSVRLIKDEGTALCRFVQVANDIDQNRYGVRYLPPDGISVDVLFSDMIDISIDSNIVFGYCSQDSGYTWDSLTDELVVLVGVTYLADGGACDAETICSYTP